MTNAIRPDILVVARGSGAVKLLSERSTGRYQRRRRQPEHHDPSAAGRDHPPPQGGLNGLTVAICSDIAHSRVARSIFPLNTWARGSGMPETRPQRLDVIRVEDHAMDEGLADATS